MANRSYIIESNTKKIILDTAYEIPIVQKILISGNSKIVPSIMYENSFAIEGDYSIGLEKLKEFFNKLIENNIYEKYDFKNQTDEFFKIIESISSKSIILEPVEIFSLDENQNIDILLDEIKNININDYALQVQKQLDEYRKKLEVINGYPDYVGLIFKKKNDKKSNLLKDVSESINYYVSSKIGV